MTETEHEAYTMPPGLRVDDGHGNPINPIGIRPRLTHVTSAQLLDAHHTAIELWPAPPAGAAVHMVLGVLVSTPGDTPYVGADSTLEIRYAGSSQVAGGSGTAVDDFLTTTTPHRAVVGPPAGTQYERDTVDGKALVLVATTALTEGNGSIDVTVIALVV